MRRTFRTRSLLVAAVAAAALVVAWSGSAATAKTVNGTVGPGFTITLTMNGKQVTKLKAGKPKPYRFVISDQADIHDFHVSGPGLNRVLTGVSFTGTKSFVLRLKKGSYRFRCDPHASIMHGSFRVS